MRMAKGTRSSDSREKNLKRHLSGILLRSSSIKHPLPGDGDGSHPISSARTQLKGNNQTFRKVSSEKMSGKKSKKKSQGKKPDGNEKNGSKKAKASKRGNKPEGKAKSGKSRFHADIFNEHCMENAYYICHNVQDVLKCRGFPWPELANKKKKGKKGK